MYDSLVLTPNHSFLFQLLEAWYLYVSSYVFHCLSWNCIVHLLEKILFKIRFFFFFLNFLFRSMYGFNQVSWLNLVVLCNFKILIYDFVLVVIFFILQHILFFSCKLATSFTTFPIFILSGKNGKSLRSLCNSLGYSTSTSRT